MSAGLTRRSALRGIGGLPILLAAGSGAWAGEPFAAALARDPRLLGFRTVSAERLAAPLATVAGRLPEDFRGTLWRSGPAEHERFGHRYGHFLDGDGMVQAFSFGGGGAEHRAALLDTPKRRRETRAGKRTVPAFGTIPPDVSGVLRSADDMNTGNISMLSHAGRLMALWEGGSALEVDPATLTTGDFVTWRADLAGAPFSAHPKIGGDGTLWNIGYLPVPRPALLLYRIGPDGRLMRFNVVPVEPLGMVHDFVVTERHLVLVLPPFVLDPERFMSGRVSFLDAHAWRPGIGTRILVVDKGTLEPVRRHELPAGFHFHHGNGWEEADGTIRLDLCQAPDPGFVLKDLRTVMQGEWRFPSVHPSYRSMVLRPDGSGGISPAPEGVAEFPRIDPRRTGLRHRRLFALAGDGGHGDWPFRRVVRLGPDTGPADGWAYPSHQIPEEHVFVPRGTEEGDGWLVGPFLDTRRRVGGINLFDAGRIADGPIWEGVLPYALPLGLHGTFTAA